MKSACEKWKDQLLDAALTGAVSADLAEHLRTCAHCDKEWKALEASKAQLDTLMPQLVQSAEPSADFRARVLFAAEAARKRKRIAHWQVWTLVGAAAAIVLVLMVWYRGGPTRISPADIAAAQRLAEWRAPSDSLLVTPGQEILKTTPKLGESYFSVPVN